MRHLDAIVAAKESKRRVLRQVQQVVSDGGIEYHHWPEGVVFKWDIAITLNTVLECVHNPGDIAELVFDFLLFWHRPAFYREYELVAPCRLAAPRSS